MAKKFDFIRHQALPGRSNTRHTPEHYWADFLYNPDKLEQVFKKYEHSKNVITKKRGVRRDPSFSYSPWAICFEIIQAYKPKITTDNQTLKNEQKSNSLRNLAMFIAAKYRFSLEEMHANLSPTESQVIVDEFLQISGTYNETKLSSETFLSIETTSDNKETVFNDGIVLSILLHRRWEIGMLIDDMLPTRPPGATVPVGSTQSKETTSSPEEQERRNLVNEIRNKQIQEKEHAGLIFLEKAARDLLEKRPNGLKFCLFKSDLIEKKKNKNDKNDRDTETSQNDYLTLPTEELLAQLSYELARYFYLEDNIQKARDYYQVCLDCLKSYTAESWICYFEELLSKKIDQIRKDVCNQLDMCNGLLEVANETTKNNAESEPQESTSIDGLVNRCMVHLASGRADKCYEMLINDTCFLKIGMSFRGFIETQIIDKKIAEKISIANIICRVMEAGRGTAWEDDLYKNVDKTVVEVPIVTKVPKESQKLDNSVKIIHEIAVEILARYPLKTDFLVVEQTISEVISSIHKRTEGLSRSKVKILMHAKFKILLKYFLENTEEQANIINQSYLTLGKLFSDAEKEYYNNLVHLRWRKEEDSIQRYNQTDININEEIPITVSTQRYLDCASETSDMSESESGVEDEHMDTKSDEDEGEVAEEESVGNKSGFVPGLQGIENSDLVYLPDTYRAILSQLGKPKLTYQLIKVIKMQYSKDYRGAKDVLNEILKSTKSSKLLTQTSTETSVISYSNNTGLPIPVIFIITNELTITDLLSYLDDSCVDSNSAPINSPNYKKPSTTSISHLIQDTSDERNIEINPQNLSSRCKKFIRAMQTYGPCKNPEQISLNNDKLTLIDRGIFTRALAYLLDQNELESFPLEDSKILGHISQQRYGILLQFAIAVQNIIKIDENRLNEARINDENSKLQGKSSKTDELTKKRSKAIKFITDCLTQAATVKIMDNSSLEQRQLEAVYGRQKVVDGMELHGFGLDDMVDLASYCKKPDASNLVVSALVKIFKARSDKTVEITPINKYEKCFKAFPGLTKYSVKLNVQGVERALRSLLQFCVNRALSGSARLADHDLNSFTNLPTPLLLTPPTPIGSSQATTKNKPPRNHNSRHSKRARSSSTNNSQIRNTNKLFSSNNNDFFIQSQNLDNQLKSVTCCPIVNSPKKLTNALIFSRGLFELEYTSKRFYPAVLAVLRFLCIGTNYFNDKGLVGAGYLNEFLLSKITKSFSRIQKDNISVLFMQCFPENLKDYSLATKIDTSIYPTNWWRYLWDAELIEMLAQNAAKRGDVHTFEYLKELMASFPSGLDDEELGKNEKSQLNRPQTDHINTDKFLDMCKSLYYLFMLH